MGRLRSCLQLRKIMLCLMLIAITVLFVSANEGEASGSYLIKINKQQNCVTIYEKNASGQYKPIKAMICSTGYDTKTGTYSLGEKLRWHTLDGPSYGQYCCRIYGAVLFHSVWYYTNQDPSTVSCAEYNKLGTTASHGCVRLTVADAKWIYDNIPSGTTVEIYNSKKAGPLGKPKAIKIPGYMSYDPTDIWSKGNPWNDKKPKITISSKKAKKLSFGSKFDVKAKVKAKNTTGYNVTDEMKISIKYKGKKVKKVNTSKPGKYVVVYSVKDELGRKAKKKVTYTVKGAKKTPEFLGIKNIYLQKKTQMTKKRALSGVTVMQGKKKLAKKYIKVTFAKVKKNVYKATYEASRDSKSAKAYAYIYIDKKAPVISGINNNEVRTVVEGTNVNEEYALRGVKVSDNVSALKVSDISLSIRVNKDRSMYTITYLLKDQAGNKTQKVIYVKFTPYYILTGKNLAIGTDALNRALDEMSASGLKLTDDSTQEEVSQALKEYCLAYGVTVKNYKGENETAGLRTEGALTAELAAGTTAGNTTVYTVTYRVNKNGRQASVVYTVSYTREVVG